MIYQALSLMFLRNTCFVLMLTKGYWVDQI